MAVLFFQYVFYFMPYNLLSAITYNKIKLRKKISDTLNYDIFQSPIVPVSDKKLAPILYTLRLSEAYSRA